MKNIKKLILLSLLFVPLLTACGNKDILGMTYTFKYATVKLPDGTLIDGEVKEWARSSDTDSVRVTFHTSLQINKRLLVCQLSFGKHQLLRYDLERPQNDNKTF